MITLTDACVLVTDGDGSLNTWKSYTPTLTATVRPRHRRGWESQRCSRGTLEPRKCRVRPRHRRGWESQRRVPGFQRVAWLRASSSPTGMGVSTDVQAARHAHRRSASSSPTGMGVSTRHGRAHRRGLHRASSSPTGMGVSTMTWTQRSVSRPSASSSPTGMGVSTAGAPTRAFGLGGCVLVTDGDGSLNYWTAAGYPRGPLCVLVTDGDGSLNCWHARLDWRLRVRPRHRRGWESQLLLPARSRPMSACVLVTDGDGSLNDLHRDLLLSSNQVRPRHRRGWESQRDGRSEVGC